MRFSQGHPIIIGLCGKAGTGKTVSANALVPEGSVRHTDLYWWDHKFLAIPLYEMATLRRELAKAKKGEERIKHETHAVLLDLFGKSVLYGLPDYDDFVELVFDICSVDIDLNPDRKPRSFLQDVGSICRAMDKDVFVKWMIRSIIRDAAWADENEHQYICIVSDVRMPNEAQGIIEQPNGVVIKFTASEEVRTNRLLNRDGFLLTSKQASHESERVNDIPSEFITYTLDTDPLSIEQQAKQVIKIAEVELGITLQNQTSPGELEHATT